jgi:hypothetical protein
MSARLLLLAAACALAASQADAEAIIGARYDAPVERYGHFALGRPHEYARLSATTDAGRTLTLDLAEDEVFEDLEPRLVTLAAGEPREILATVSRRDNGSRLVMMGLRNGRLEISAQSPAIGVPMRWMNVVGAADLDGDGKAEIAAVTTPHIGGTLRVYRRRRGELREIAALSGFSNHVYGSPELGLSAPVAAGGRTRLVVPDASRLSLRVIELRGAKLVEVSRCPIPGAMAAAIKSALMDCGTAVR